MALLRLASKCRFFGQTLLRRLLEQTLLHDDGEGNPADIECLLKNLNCELTYFENMLHGEYFVSCQSVADFALYPLLALVKRLHDKQPQHGAESLIGTKLSAFMQHVEQLPYFNKTTPPHWRKE